MSVDRIWELLTKKFNNEISSEELDELELLLHENQDAFQLNELLSRLGDIPFKPVADEAMESRSRHTIKEMIGVADKQDCAENIPGDYNGHIACRNHLGKRIRTGAAVLATLLLLLTIVWLYFREKNDTGKELVSVNEIKTNAGSKTTVNLPDGSAVVLNAGSTLSYNKEFGISSRQITLTGEAYFDIRKNPGMPLVVHAGTVDIWVKGTTFNVKAYPKDPTIEAALFTGIIELVSQKDPERKILLRPSEKITISKKLSPSQNKHVPGNEEWVSLTRINPDPVDSSYAEIAWLQKELVFRSEKFSQLARSMESRYNVTIKFMDARVSNLVFTGSFTNETLAEALESLKGTVPFHYTIEDKTVLIGK